MESSTKEKHIRPKIRNRPPKVESSASSSATSNGGDGGDLDSLLESTRKRIQSQLHVSENVNNTDEKQMAPPGQQAESPDTSVEVPQRNSSKTPPKSILKQPKYSSAKNRATREQLIVPETVSDTGYEGPETSLRPLRVAAVKDVVLEREPIAQQLPEQQASLAVEGYTPKLQQDSKQEPVVVSSISDLLEKAGTLPSSDETTPQVVEADLQFACMTAEEYDETVEYSKEMQDTDDDVFLGRDTVFLGSDDDESMVSGESDMSEEAPPQPRAFIKLWEAISGWATYKTAVLLKQWREDGMADDEVPPQVDRSDIGSSRRKGLKSMLSMYLATALDDLGIRQEDQRRVDVRIDNLLRTFNYSRPMAKLDPTLWKALTCIMVEMVLADSSITAEEREVTSLPGACKDVGMVLDEYEYLAQSAVLSLEQGTNAGE